MNSSHSCSCTVMMYTTYMSGISAQIRRGWNTNLPDHSTTQLRSDLCISTLCKSHYSKGQLQIHLWSIVTVL